MEKEAASIILLLLVAIGLLAVLVNYAYEANTKLDGVINRLGAVNDKIDGVINRIGALSSRLENATAPR